MQILMSSVARSNGDQGGFAGRSHRFFCNALRFCPANHDMSSQRTGMGETVLGYRSPVVRTIQTSDLLQPPRGMNRWPARPPVSLEGSAKHTEDI